MLNDIFAQQLAFWQAGLRDKYVLISRKDRKGFRRESAKIRKNKIISAKYTVNNLPHNR